MTSSGAGANQNVQYTCHGKIALSIASKHELSMYMIGVLEVGLILLRTGLTSHKLSWMHLACTQDHHVIVWCQS